jgi:hypothetical protein
VRNVNGYYLCSEVSRFRHLVANQVGTYNTYVDVSCIAMGQIYDEKNFSVDIPSIHPS